MTAPPAEGARVAWQDVPRPVREAIERVCGAPVTEAHTQQGGFSPGVAARVRCADGTRCFVKAASADINPDTPRLHRREASVLADLDPLIAAGRLPVPRLWGTAELGQWFALVVDDVDGRQPALPWRDAELDSVLAALDRLADVLTPAPTTAPAIADRLGADFTGWGTLSLAPDDDRIDPWSRARLTELAALEATWAAHAAGPTLLHADIRADNLLLASDGVMVVDSLRPPPPGLPTVRRFQAAQAEVTRRWLATLLLPRQDVHRHPPTMVPSRRSGTFVKRGGVIGEQGPRRQAGPAAGPGDWLLMPPGFRLRGGGHPGRTPAAPPAGARMTGRPAAPHGDRDGSVVDRAHRAAARDDRVAVDRHAYRGCEERHDRRHLLGGDEPADADRSSEPP